MTPRLRIVPVLLALAAGCSHGSSAGSSAAGAVGAAAESASGEVKIGRCVGINGLAETKAMGFDYAELPVRDLAKLSDAEFEQAVATHKEVGLPTPTANVFLPNEMKIVGPGVDQAPAVEFARKGLDRMARLEVKIVVFGSGGARKVPEGFSKDEAFAQLVTFAKKIAPEAQARGITMAVEPLKTAETNIINSVTEGLKWVEAVDHPSFQLMADLYHMGTEKEDPGNIVAAREHIRHFHIANPNKRVVPLEGDGFDYSGYFAAIKKIGYHGTISLEAPGTKDFATDGPRSLAFLRAQLGSGARPSVAAAAR
jgi:D-psicose/D-tagatose/L-ribulose 3-epimerase